MKTKMQQVGFWEIPAASGPDPRIVAIVTAWRNDTELSAARAMYEIAGLLGIDPPKPVAGKRRRVSDGTR